MTATEISASSCRWVSKAAPARASLAFSKVAAMSWLHPSLAVFLSLPLVASVGGLRIEAATLMKRL